MPLESLSQSFNPDEPGRKIREVQIEHEPEREETGRARYERIKKIYFRKGSWKKYDNDRISNATEFPYDIVLRSYVEARVGAASSMNEAEEMIMSSSDELGPEEALRFLPNKPEVAKKIYYEKLKNYKYDVSRGLYFDKTGNRNIDALEMLCTLSFIYPEEARKELEDLKKNFGISPKSNWLGPKTFSIGQTLRSILIESSYDTDMAQRHYDQLKETEGYDRDRALWRTIIRDTTPETECALYHQLLGLLIELNIEEAQQKQLPAHHQEIPEERNF